MIPILEELPPIRARREDRTWGLGWGLQQDGNDRGFWQWGHNAGHRAFVLGLPASQTGVVIFTNSDHGMSIAKSVLAETIGGTQPAVNWQNYASIEDKPKRKSKNARVPVHIAEIDTENTMIYLRAESGRLLPLSIGQSETLSIRAERSEEPLPRPMTHDLFGNLLDHASGRVVETRITAFKLPVRSSHSSCPLPNSCIDLAQAGVEVR